MHEVRGKVKAMKITEFRSVDSSGVIVKDFFKEIEETEYFFDINGNCTKYIKSYIDNDVISSQKTSYEYNEIGNRIIERVDTSITAEWKYNSKGLLREEKIYDVEANLIEKSNFEYNNKGNRVKKILFSNEMCFHCNNTDYGYTYERMDSVSRIYTYQYNENGNLIEHKEISSKNEVVKTVNFYFNNAGNKYLKKEFNNIDSLVTKEEWEYNEFGDLINEIQSCPIQTWCTVYNLQGKIIEEFGKDHNEIISTKVVFLRDDYGNSVSMKVFNDVDGTLNLKQHSISRYEYDDKGNWIKRGYFIDENPRYIMEREILYYK